jgi:hypothetical protein
VPARSDVIDATKQRTTKVIKEAEFEGVGIKPDIEVHPTIGSLKSSHDTIMEKALKLAEKL